MAGPASSSSFRRRLSTPRHDGRGSLPDQVIKVYVRVNDGRAVRKVVGWDLLTVAGGALGAWARAVPARLGCAS